MQPSRCPDCAVPFEVLPAVPNLCVKETEPTRSMQSCGAGSQARHARGQSRRGRVSSLILVRCQLVEARERMHLTGGGEKI